MLGRYGETLVVDWGLAKPMGKSDERRQHADEPTVVPKSKEGSSETRMGTVVGTLAYMSPEQAQGKQHLLGPRSDVYCLGATLYCVLTGQPPIERGSEGEMLDAIRNGRIQPPHQVQPAVPRPLSAICMKALALNPNDRYSSAVKLADDIELWLADESVSAYQEPFFERLGRFVRRHQTMVTATAASLAMGIIILAIMYQVVASRNRDLKVARDAADESAKQALASRNTVIQLAVDTLMAAEGDLRTPTKVQAFRSKVMNGSYSAFTDLKIDQIDNPKILYEFAKVARLSANQQGRTVNFAEAIKRLLQSIQIQETLLTEGSDGIDDRKNYLGETYRDLGGWYKLNAQYDDAVKAYDRSASIVEELLAKTPDSKKVLRSQAVLNYYASALRIEYLEYEKSLNGLKQSCEFFTAAFAAKESQSEDEMTACLCYQAFARQLLLMERYEEVESWCTEALPPMLEWRQQISERERLLMLA